MSVSIFLMGRITLCGYIYVDGQPVAMFQHIEGVTTYHTNF